MDKLKWLIEEHKDIGSHIKKISPSQTPFMAYLKNKKEQESGSSKAE